MHLTCEAAIAQGAVDIVPKVISPAPVTQGAPIRLYGASKALVIGIDNYDSAKAQSQGAWPRLAMAVKDAEAVAKALADQGFKVTLRKDLPAAALDTAFRDFFLSDGADPEARLLIWFAGHGHTISGEGYLVPADAPHPETHDVEFRRKAISLRRFGEYMREARAKHVLAVFDSCFAGTVFNVARSGPPPAVTHSTALPVRQFVTSGEAEQQVSDDGTFRKLFIDALKGLEPAADANRDGYITGTELGQFLFDKVTNLTNRAQTPRFGKLNALSYDRGDFVLQAAKLTGTASRPPQSSSNAAPQVSEASIAWEQVKTSTSTDVLEAFVRQFPGTVHTALARDRIEELRRLALVEKERADALKLAMKREPQMAPAEIAKYSSEGDTPDLSPTARGHWKRMRDPERYARNYERLEVSSAERFPQTVTVFDIPMSAERKSGVPLSANEYVELFVLDHIPLPHPLLVVQVRLNRGRDWLLSRQTFKVASWPSLANRNPNHDAATMELFRATLQNEIDAARHTLISDFMHSPAPKRTGLFDDIIAADEQRQRAELDAAADNPIDDPKERGP